jgi:glycosyltransferase involved in cell wall biosynthesis
VTSLRGARIGIDARAADAHPSGLTMYARELVRALTELDRRNQYVIIRRPDAGPPFAAAASSEEVMMRGDASTPTLGGGITRLDLDLYHSLHHFLPFGFHARHVVVTLHDLIWVEHPRLIRDGRFATVSRTITHLYARGSIARALRRADRIVAISSYSRERAIERLGIDPSRVDVVHHGVSRDRFHPATESNAGSERRYFLCVGNTKPYKNITTALEAFARCTSDVDATVVIVGRGDSLPRLRALASRLGIADRVEFAGAATDADLLGLFHGALALVFPSIVEGFGLPVLEAMAAGCPVIGSTAPAVREVASSAAILCDPGRPDEFAAAMTRVASDPALRERLRAAGLARADEFTWRRCAEQTLAVYDRALTSRRPADRPQEGAA